MPVMWWQNTTSESTTTALERHYVCTRVPQHTREHPVRAENYVRAGSSRMAVLMDDSAETVLSIYGEAFDLLGFTRLRPRSQGAAAASDRWVRCSL